MARRNKEDKWLSILPGLAGLIALFYVLPSSITGGALSILFRIAVGAAALLIVAGVVILLIRRVKNAASNTGASHAPDSRGANPIQSTSELVLQIRAMDWFQFEKLVEIVFTQLGYEVTRRGGANPDGGIDLIIVQAGEPVAVQCKQWKTRNVPVKDLREFLGALTASKIKRGLFITLCGYTDEAKHLADNHDIELLNEVGFSKLLEAMDARHNPECLAVLQDPRKLCPKCESEMVLRRAAKGANAGQQFWGCSTYPRCNYTMQTT